MLGVIELFASRAMRERVTCSDRSGHDAQSDRRGRALSIRAILGSRVAVLLALVQGARTLHEVVNMTGLPLASVSRALNELRQRGLVL